MHACRVQCRGLVQTRWSDSTHVGMCFNVRLCACTQLKDVERSTTTKTLAKGRQRPVMTLQKGDRPCLKLDFNLEDWACAQPGHLTEMEAEGWLVCKKSVRHSIAAPGHLPLAGVMAPLPGRCSRKRCSWIQETLVLFLLGQRMVHRLITQDMTSNNA